MAFKSSNSLYGFFYNLITEYINGGKIPRDKDVASLQKELKAKRVPAESYQLTSIQAQFMTAVREINKHGDLLDYSYEDRKRFVIDAVKVAVLKDSDYSAEFTERLDRGIEVIMSEIIDLWKRN